MSMLRRSSLLPGSSSFFNDLFEDDRFWNTSKNEWLSSIPSANIIESDKTFRIELAVPGMTKSDFRVDVDSGHLRVSTEKPTNELKEGDTYTRQEFSYSSFMRSFILPESIDTENIQAKYENGVLEISLPKKIEPEKSTKKEISIT